MCGLHPAHGKGLRTKTDRRKTLPQIASQQLPQRPACGPPLHMANWPTPQAPEPGPRNKSPCACVCVCVAYSQSRLHIWLKVVFFKKCIKKIHLKSVRKFTKIYIQGILAVKARKTLRSHQLKPRHCSQVKWNHYFASETTRGGWSALEAQGRGAEGPKSGPRPHCAAAGNGPACRQQTPQGLRASEWLFLRKAAVRQRTVG